MILPVNNLTAITPLDGRYASKTKDLQHFFSEFALIKYRVHVEVEYLIYLDLLFGWKTVDHDKLRERVKNFSVEKIHGKSRAEIKRARSCPRADFKITETDAPHNLPAVSKRQLVVDSWQLAIRS